MKTLISINTLKAALLCAAKKDIRYYLNGVLLDFKLDCDTPHINVIATDGHLLAAYRDNLDEYRGDDFSVIVPRDIIKTALSLCGKLQTGIEFSHINGVYTLGDITFSPVDGKFPDYMSVIPSRASAHPDAAQISYFDPELMLTAEKSLNIYYGDKAKAKGKNACAFRASDESAILHRGKNNAIVVIMPMRVEKLEYQGFNA